MSDKSNISQNYTSSPVSQAAAAIMPVQEVLNYSLEKESRECLPIQCKLSIGSPDDPLEHEADVVADKVMRMPEQNFVQRKCPDCEKEDELQLKPETSSFVHRKCAECEEEEEELQRKPLASPITPFIQAKGNKGGIASDSISQKIDSTKGGGSSMDGGTQGFMESRFGTDFSGVKIHTDENAVQMSQELNAQAFTTGSDVYFNAGKYDPSSETGKHLLAHELTHTIQQSNNIQTKLIQKAVETDEPAKEPGVDACSEWDRDP